MALAMSQLLHLDANSQRVLDAQAAAQKVLEHGERRDKLALLQSFCVPNLAHQLAVHRKFCRVLQKCFDVGVFRESDTDLLVASLLPGMWKLATHESGNFVVQSIVEHTGKHQVELVAWALQQSWEVLAKDRHGCRVMERLIEHAPEALLRYGAGRLLANGEALARHPFGNFVIQSFMNFGIGHEELARQLLPVVCAHSQHRTASHVLQTALANLGPHFQWLVVNKLLDGHEGKPFEDLLDTRYGTFVVQQVLKEEYPGSCAMRRRVGAEMDRLLQSDDWGKTNLLDVFGVKFFELESEDETTTQDSLGLQDSLDLVTDDGWE